MQRDRKPWLYSLQKKGTHRGWLRARMADRWAGLQWPQRQKKPHPDLFLQVKPYFASLTGPLLLLLNYPSKLGNYTFFKVRLLHSLPQLQGSAGAFQCRDNEQSYLGSKAGLGAKSQSSRWAYQGQAEKNAFCMKVCVSPLTPRLTSYIPRGASELPLPTSLLSLAT